MFLFILILLSRCKFLNVFQLFVVFWCSIYFSVTKISKSLFLDSTKWVLNLFLLRHYHAKFYMLVWWGFDCFYPVFLLPDVFHIVWLAVSLYCLGSGLSWLSGVDFVLRYFFVTCSFCKFWHKTSAAKCRFCCLVWRPNVEFAGWCGFWGFSYIFGEPI